MERWPLDKIPAEPPAWLRMKLPPRSRSVLITMILAITAAVLGFWTLSRHNRDASLLDLVFWTLQMFTAENLDQLVEQSNVSFDIARILAPLATFMGVIAIALELMSERYARWRIGRLRDHSVICGLHGGGRDLALRERAAGRAVVVIATAPAPADEVFCAAHRIGLLHGEARDPHVLEAAALASARRLVVVTGEDKVNLDVTLAAGLMLAGVSHRKRPLRMFASIDDEQLWDELSRSDAIRRDSVNCELTAFNPRNLVARHFFWDESICLIADLRDLPRVHAVFLGCGPYGQALIAQLLRACVYRNFVRPVVTVLCADPVAELRRLRLHCPDIEDVADITFEVFDLGGEALDVARMIAVERKSPVTAVFVCADADDTALRTAVYVRNSIHRHGSWRAPVYVRMGQFDHVGDLLKTDGDARRFEDLLRFFGSDADHCRLDMIEGELEQLAVRTHEAYRATRASHVEGDTANSRQEPLVPWPELRETYREANRRAADHVKAKLESAGCVVPPGTTFMAPPDFRLGATPALREALAALEHRSWCLGRRLDGWRPGARRDNKRRIHDNLVDYDALTESLKDYDRDQIDLIDTQLIARRKELPPDAPAVRRDHWIGLIGRNRVSVEEAEWVRRVLVDQVLPALLSRHEHAHLTLLTPLAPGLDLVLATTALTLLRSRHRACRLLVVEGVPAAMMLEDYREAFEAGSAWGGEPRRTDEQWMQPGRPDVGGRARIAAERQRMIRDPACAWLIDLSEPDADYTLESCRQQSYRAAGDYIARRAHTLIAATHSHPASPQGGVMETLQRRPAALAARLAGWPVAEPCSTVHLELDARRVTVQRES